jgi:hypothetical protein
VLDPPPVPEPTQNLAGSDASAAMFMAPPAPSVPAPSVAPVPVDAARLQATLGGALSPATIYTVAHHPDNLRAAMLLGSPDFMQH